MAGWVGWRAQLLRAAGLTTGGEHDAFMLDWNFHATTDCRNNPVDISRPATSATHCARLTATRTARNYITHAQGAAAFSGQLHSSYFPHLLAALKTPNPYAYSDPGAVVKDLQAWGSTKFANYYAAHATSGTGPGTGPGGSGIGAPKGHSGYHSLQKALAKSLPTNLHRSKVIRGRVLRKMGAPHNLH